MKRLTEWIGTAVSLCCESCLGMPQNCDCEDCQREATNRLFAIENILGDEYDLDRLRELAQADREGRCVVLPAKPDQTIYQWRKGDDCPSVSRLDGVQINADGEITYPIWCGHLTPGDFGKTVFLTREEAALRREQDG